MGLIWIVGAAAWGAAEASFFFFVPDILLTFAAIRFGFLPGLRLALTAAVSAALAGTALWLWAAHDAASARAAMLMVPAVGPDLLARAHRAVAAPGWPLALLWGAVTGVPYKLYAVEAGARVLPLYVFLPASLAARLARFTLTVALAGMARRLLPKRIALRLWAAGWTTLYLVYFGLRATAH
jgi:hypothetical protein